MHLRGNATVIGKQQSFNATPASGCHKPELVWWTHLHELFMDISHSHHQNGHLALK